MKKKMTLVVTALTLVVVMAIGGTLAYFTDSKTVTNTFTVGDVEIDLIEAALHRANPESTLLNNPKYKVGVQDDETIQKAAEEYADYLTKMGTNMVPGRAVLKCPYVVNTGDNAAYIRITMTFPKEMMANGGLGNSMYTASAIHKDYSYINAGVMVDGPEFTMTQTKNDAGDTVVTWIRNKPLEVGEMTYWNVWGYIRMATGVTSEDVDGITDFNVVVTADAIQAEGFTDTVDEGTSEVTTSAVEKAWAAFDEQQQKNP